MSNEYRTTSEVSAEEIAQHCIDQPSFGFAVLAELAYRKIDLNAAVLEGYDGSSQQYGVIDLLEKLADAIRKFEGEA